ncbi:MAG: glutathione S-transferase [Oceanospirillaceae bacterium]|jgi:glutathione S-transferase
MSLQSTKPQQIALQSIELISFNLCPFVQRSVITLLNKGIDFKITYIELADKPDWFLKISPMGKVPVLRYGDEVLFESAAINEFIDEITPNSLMPTSPLLRAKDRSWIEYASQITMDQYSLSVANNEEDYQTRRDILQARLQKLEQQLSGSLFFNSDHFSLVDAALTPVFTRLEIIAQRFNKNLMADFPKLRKLAANYLTQTYVEKSVIDDFEQVYIDFLSKNNSVLVV